ncbi:plastocyanin/azurin family copper-binding protein [Egicoccus sp. AB-alg2]|uniref:cupredoxin domain-containing protein n=1 Tax=Egicoccus sp. AB-alg2 TaxID=3242693 RepID=UPI00359CD3D3
MRGWSVVLVCGGLLAGTVGCSGTGATDAQVLMTGELRFEPTTVEIPAGGSVTWRNDGQRPHTVTAIDRDRQPTGDFDSGEIIGTGTFTHTFQAAGTYVYHCEFHGRSEMVGIVEVTP